MQSKRGLATCPPVAQGKQRQARTGSATHVLLRVLRPCAADGMPCGWHNLRLAGPQSGRRSSLPGRLSSHAPSPSAPGDIPARPSALVSARAHLLCVSCQCPGGVLRLDGLRLVPWSLGWWPVQAWSSRHRLGWCAAVPHACTGPMIHGHAPALPLHLAATELGECLPCMIELARAPGERGGRVRAASGIHGTGSAYMKVRRAG